MSLINEHFYQRSVLLGVDVRKTARTLRGLSDYMADFKRLKAQARDATTVFRFATPYPCFEDRHTEGGIANGHYFHQDLLVARRIHRHGPDIHMDVGSRVDGFVAHVASFRPIVVLDIRPMRNTIPNITFRQLDLMAELAPELVGACDSLSCLHALEHFGLGRYGDTVQYDGYLVGLDNLTGILKAGGTLYLSVPIGPQRIEFNAHRVFSVRYLMQCLAGRYTIKDFSFVDDAGNLHESCDFNAHAIDSNFGCNYGCGIFEMIKL